MSARSRRSKPLSSPSSSPSRRRIPIRNGRVQSKKPGDVKRGGMGTTIKGLGRRRRHCIADDHNNNKENAGLPLRKGYSILSVKRKQASSKRARSKPKKADDDDGTNKKTNVEQTTRRKRRTARTLVPGLLDASTAAALAARSSSSFAAGAGAGAVTLPPSSSAAAAAAATTAVTLFEAGNDDDDDVTEYERQRAERIRRNREMLAALRVPEAAAGAARAAAAAAAAATNAAAGRPRPPPRPRPPRDRSFCDCRRRPTSVPTRASARTRGLEPGSDLSAVASSRSSSGGGGGGCGGSGREAGSGSGSGSGSGDLSTIEEYWAERGGNPCSDPIVSDGTYKGWVAPDVCSRFGIEPTREASWQAFPPGGSGGSLQSTFFRKTKKRSSDAFSSSSSSSVPPELRARGWSEARARAATQLRRNPNAFFYRHVEPGQQQANGEWTPEEHEAFLRVAREHGVGDKWGLFASWLPHRVGYQASAYYREVVIPSGEAIDARFRMTRRTGKAVFVG